MSGPLAPIVEIFASIQGEGIFVGMPQIFVRFAGCDLDCLYCDTEYAKQIPEVCTFHLPSGDTTQLPNPVSITQLRTTIDELINRDHFLDTLTLTGGEPLLHPQYIAGLAQSYADEPMTIYLETAGHLPQALAAVSNVVDVVAADIKLPSTLATIVSYDDMREFWKLAIDSDAFAFAKMVLTDAVTENDLIEAGEQLGDLLYDSIPLILQPVTPSAKVQPPSWDDLWRLTHVATHWFYPVRVIPQCHRLIGAR